MFECTSHGPPRIRDISVKEMFWMMRLCRSVPPLVANTSPATNSCRSGCAFSKRRNSSRLMRRRRTLGLAMPHHTLGSAENGSPRDGKTLGTPRASRGFPTSNHFKLPVTSAACRSNQLATFARSFTAFESFWTRAPSHEPLTSAFNEVESAVSASFRADPAAFSADDSASLTVLTCFGERHLFRSSWSTYARASANDGGHTNFG